MAYNRGDAKAGPRLMDDEVTPSPVWGGLRWVQPRKIAGWAYAPRRPDEHLHIEIRLDNALVATVQANAPYDQLERSGICAADHGFVAETEIILPVDLPHLIEAAAIGAGGERLRLYLPGAKPEDEATTNRRLVRFAPVDRQAHPVFVLGAARSGTSIMGRALRRTGRFMGHGEGHLLSLLTKLGNTARRHYAGEGKAAEPGAFTMLAGVPEAVIEEGLRAMFARILRAQFPDGAWMEKTPGAEMIRAAPQLARIWPNARFIFVRRRAIENLQSRRRKFPDFEFEEHCRLWADSMQAWLDIRESMGATSLEIEHLDIALRPADVATRLTALLELSPEETALLTRSLREDRPQQTADRFAEVLDPAGLDWTETEREIFAQICGPAMRVFGYADEEGRPGGLPWTQAGVAHRQAAAGDTAAALPIAASWCAAPAWVQGAAHFGAPLLPDG